MPLLQLLWWLRVGVLVKRWPLLGVGGMPPKAKKPTAAEAKAKASAEKALRTQLKIKTVTNLKAAAVSLGAKKAGSSMVAIMNRGGSMSRQSTAFEYPPDSARRTSLHGAVHEFMALASDVPRIVDAMLRGYVKAVVGKGLRALMVVEPDPAGEMRVTWAKRLNVRQIAQMVCEIMSGFRDSNGRLTKVPGRRPPSETDINQIDTDVRAAILDLLWRPAITLPPFRMVLATRRCFLVTTTELAQVTVIDRDSVMDSDLVVGRSQLAVPENPLSDVALGFEAGGGHFTDACRRFFILNDIEDRIRWVILKGAFRITDTSGLNLFVSESGGGKTSMIRRT